LTYCLRKLTDATTAIAGYYLHHFAQQCGCILSMQLFEFCHSDYSFDLDAIPQAYRRGLDT
jgi:hypothetical protein